MKQEDINLPIEMYKRLSSKSDKVVRRFRDVMKAGYGICDVLSREYTKRALNILTAIYVLEERAEREGGIDRVLNQQETL